MKTLFHFASFLLVLFTVSTACAEPRIVWLDEMDMGFIRQGWDKAQPGKSVQGKQMKTGEKVFSRGVGSHAPGAFYVELDGNVSRFTSVIGVDAETNGKGSISIFLYCDGKEAYRSGILKGDGPAAEVDIDIKGVHLLAAVMKDSGDGKSFDHVDWADARFEFEGAAPKLVRAPSEEKFILTPKPPKEPKINGARAQGVRPGSPFIYRIAATGERPLKFQATGLPEGLSLNPDNGVISGTIVDQEAKTHSMMITASNSFGRTERELKILVGDTLALAPPMGWNDWYAHYDRITDAMMRQAADIMVSTGMADVGYQYVNIDDCWMNRPTHTDGKRTGPLRDDNGDIMPNSYFPDMKGMTDYIHAKGLRAGLYTSPGAETCAGCVGSLNNEERDAHKFAEWGFDFLKYDWCSYGAIAKDNSLDELQKPYRKMSAALKKQKRDFVFNLCQYGMGEVWKWGAEVGGHCWRTAGDLGIELESYHDVALQNANLWLYAKPGSWNDPDYLQIGFVGNAIGLGLPTPCPLTPNEQYSFMSLWCLMASPLFYSGDMTQLDEFALNVLCNPEVIEIDQDTLGAQGYPKAFFDEDEAEVWTKPLSDGSIAIGLFNRSEAPRAVIAHLSDIGLKGKQRLRDLWRQKDLGVFEKEFRSEVARHGVVLLRAWATD
jgi:alpha-galactosidase